MWGGTFARRNGLQLGYRGLCGLEKEQKVRFDTFVIMGGGLAALSVAC